MTTVAVRMLDNVLDATVWPLPEQHDEATAKRRIGLGFTGLGDALIMLGLRYDSARPRAMARASPQAMRDAAYDASVDLAVRRVRSRCSMPTCTCRAAALPRACRRTLKRRIRAQGMRNSHLLSIAPTGTISLAFADNATNGIEPPFSWIYTRNKREADGTQGVRGRGPRLAPVPRIWAATTSRCPMLRHRAGDERRDHHAAMVAAVAPFVDTGDQQDGQRAGGVSVRGFRGAVLLRPGSRA